MEQKDQGWYDDHVYAVIFAGSRGRCVLICSPPYKTPRQETGVFQSRLLQ